MPLGSYQNFLRSSMSDKKTEKSLSKRSAIAASWEFASVFTQAVIQFAVMAILARLIGPNEFGIYAIVSTSLIMIALFSEIGIGQAVVQQKEITEDYLSTSFILSIFLGLVTAIVCWLLSPAIAWFFKQPDVVSMVRVASLSLFFGGYVSVATSLLERELMFKKLAIINITSYTVGYGVVGIGLAFIRIGAWAIIIAFLSQSFIRALMLIAMTRSKVARAFSKKELKNILRFCGGVSLARIFNNAAYQVDNLVVGRLMGPFSLGLYQMGFQIMDLPRRFLAGVIDRVMYAAFSRIQDDINRMRSAYTRALELANAILIPVTALMIILAPEAIRVILGAKWQGLIVPLQIMLIQVPLRASVRMGDMSGTALGKVYAIGILKIFYAGMIGIAAIVGVRWGLQGVTIAVSIAVLANLVMMVRFTMSYLKITFLEYLKTFIPGGLIAALIVVTMLPSAWIIRKNLGSDLVILIVLLSLSTLMIIFAIWLRPGIIGKTGLRLLLDFGKQNPLFLRAFIALEKRCLEQDRCVCQ